MPIFITRGRFSQDAMKGMLAKPEDRAEAVGQLIAKAGGKLIDYYMTFGEYDFLIISELPPDVMATPSIVATASGAVTGLTSEHALTSAEMKNAFAKAAPVAAGFRPAGAD